MNGEGKIIGGCRNIDGSLRDHKQCQCLLLEIKFSVKVFCFFSAFPHHFWLLKYPDAFQCDPDCFLHSWTSEKNFYFSLVFDLCDCGLCHLLAKFWQLLQPCRAEKLYLDQWGNIA